MHTHASVRSLSPRASRSSPVSLPLQVVKIERERKRETPRSAYFPFPPPLRPVNCTRLSPSGSQEPTYLRHGKPPPPRGFPLLGWDKSLAHAGTREGRRSLISPAGRHIPLSPPHIYPLPYRLLSPDANANTLILKLPLCSLSLPLPR